MLRTVVAMCLAVVAALLFAGIGAWAMLDPQTGPHKGEGLPDALMGFIGFWWLFAAIAAVVVVAIELRNKQGESQDVRRKRLWQVGALALLALTNGLTLGMFAVVPSFIALLGGFGIYVTLTRVLRRSPALRPDASRSLDDSVE